MSDQPNIVTVTDDNFKQEVMEHDGFVLVDFWAEWCGPCKMLAPELEKLAEKYSHLRIAKVDVDANPQLAGAFQVMSIPTMMLVTMEKNEEGKRKSAFTMGFRPLPALEEWLKGAGFDLDAKAEAPTETEESTESEDAEADETE